MWSQAFALTVKQRKNDLIFVIRSEEDEDVVRSEDQRRNLPERGGYRPMSSIQCVPT